MFGSPFNSAGFNVGYIYGVEYAVTGVSSLVLGANVYLGARYVVSGTLDIAFGAAATPARAIPTGGESAMAFGVMAAPERLIRCVSDGAVTISGAVTLRADYRVAANPDIAFDGAAILGAQYRVSSDGTLVVDLSASPVREFRLSGLFAGLLFAAWAELGNLETETVLLNITLAPGQTLVIDTEQYTVTLDGENALQAYSGAWPKLRMGSRELLVQPGSGGNLTTEVLYAEKWL